MLLEVETFYWVPDESFVWAPAKCTASDPERGSSFQKADGSTVEYPVEKVLDFDLVDPQQLDGVDDICTLKEVNSAALLHTCRVRYMTNAIYTKVGRILIAVNPFAVLPITGQSWIDKFRTGCTDPHIFGIGSAAYSNLSDGQGSQVILVAGESGAGKTESAKLVFKFLAEVGGGGQNIEKKILQTNPILEAFGNAKTVRNDNSSRFGKWVEIGVNASVQIQDAKIIDYLLESTRVVAHASAERSFHVFYQLVRGGYAAGSIEDYDYLAHGDPTIPHVNDAVDFEDLRNAFQDMEIDDEEILTMATAVLTMGNIRFENSDVIGPEGSKVFDSLQVHVQKGESSVLMRLCRHTHTESNHISQTKNNS